MVPAHSDHFGSPNGCHSVPTVQHGVCVADPCVNGMSPVSARSQCGATAMGHQHKVPMVLGPCPQHLQHEVPTIPSQGPSWIWRTVSMLGPHTAGTAAPVSPEPPAWSLLDPSTASSASPSPCPQHLQPRVPSVPSTVPSWPHYGAPTFAPSVPTGGSRDLPKHPKTPRAAAPRVKDP